MTEMDNLREKLDLISDKETEIIRLKLIIEIASKLENMVLENNLTGAELDILHTTIQDSYTIIKFNHFFQAINRG